MTGRAGRASNFALVANRWETGRIEAFSDGVFAIAITLLVLEIGVPEEAFDDLWSGIAHEWPSYLGYATSFSRSGASGSPITGSFGACAT